MVTDRPPLRVGFLGTGAIAREHAAAMRHLGHQVVAGCCRTGDSPRWTRFRTENPGVRWVPDGMALLADDDVDAVVACLPWHETPHWLEKLLESKKPVLLEKPIALCSAEIRRALSRNRELSANKMVGYNRRFYETVGKLRERLGARDLRSAEVTLSEQVAATVQEYGEAVVPHCLAVTASSNLLDLATHLLGPLKIIRLWRSQCPYGAHNFVACNGVLQTADGTPVFLALNEEDPANLGLRLRFDDHTIWHLSPLETLSVYAGMEVDAPVPGRTIRRYRPKVIDRLTVNTGFKPGFIAQAKSFLNGVPGIAATVLESAELLALMEDLTQSGD